MHATPNRPPDDAPAPSRRRSRVAAGAGLGAAVAGLVAASLVTRTGAPSPTVCPVYAAIAPIVELAPYGEVAVVDEREAAALADGCAHAGDHELTPSCELWSTQPAPTKVTVLDADACAVVRAG